MFVAIIVAIVLAIIGFVVFYCVKNSRNAKLKKVERMLNELDNTLMGYMYSLDKLDLSYEQRMKIKNKLEQGYIHRTKLLQLRWQIKYNKKI